MKFYREKAKLTQQQLGEGICSDTHVSKIERGITDYSPEITCCFLNGSELILKRRSCDLKISRYFPPDHLINKFNFRQLE
ncbi:helix-turn-helix transcriptional regulator [Cytobacillus pseudoceanisediminis]|nr:helix-turn-helix transcriptional regulator [Cytobacillus pseudoceanisediminis]MCM3393700.1 helix-turn-helix transcriptional regulator [Cytobacillus oceanisediminis]UQX56851.1 helix-turn-helix transcriptional regulator [Cytobacillus pseudoceanisediminis]